MIPDINDPEFFDKWRAGYNSFTNEEQAMMANLLEERWPEQKHFHFEYFEPFLAESCVANVLEIGGWKGELASQALAKIPTIKRWRNFEVCSNALEKTVEFGPHLQEKYASFNVGFDWFRDLVVTDVDLAVAAHMIEHLSNSDFVDLIHCLKRIPTIVFEAPLCGQHNRWSGYLGTHKLTLGWDHICDFMDDLGYGSTKISDDCFAFRLR